MDNYLRALSIKLYTTTHTVINASHATEPLTAVNSLNL